MSRTLLVVAVLAITLLGSPVLQAKEFPKEAYVGGFLIGPQAYTFNKFTFFEAIDKAKQAGAKVIEAFPGQKLSPDDPRPFNFDAPKEVLDKAQAKLKEAGIILVNFGVVGMGDTEESMRKVFDFAKALEIPCITTEPGKEEDFAILDKLVKEYDIKVAIHNHPKPSKYWDPKYTLKCLEGHDPRIGSCADTGHWMRSGVKPLEALAILKGRIVSSHLKDLNKFGEGAHDVHYGTGEGKVKEVLDELRKQGFNGNIAIEYEYNWENNVDDVAACIDFVKKYGEKAEKK